MNVRGLKLLLKNNQYSNNWFITDNCLVDYGGKGTHKWIVYYDVDSEKILKCLVCGIKSRIDDDYLKKCFDELIEKDLINDCSGDY